MTKIKKQRTGLIYKVKNKLTNKVYIGQTIRTFDNRVKAHIYDSHTRKNREVKSHFHNALRKYKLEDWEWSVEENNIPKDELNEKEIYYIAFYDSYNKDKGYNSTKGGDGGTGTARVHKLHNVEFGWIETTVQDFTSTYNISADCINRVIYKHTIQYKGWSLGEDVMRELTEQREEAKKIRELTRIKFNRLKTIKKEEEKRVINQKKAEMVELRKIETKEQRLQRLKHKKPNKAKTHTIIFEGKEITDTLRGFKEKYNIPRHDIYYAKGKKGRTIPVDYHIKYIQ